MKIRVLVRILGQVNGHDWPEPGEVMELNDVAAEGMISNGHAEAVAEKVEKRPASKANVEKRGKSGSD